MKKILTLLALPSALLLASLAPSSTEDTKVTLTPALVKNEAKETLRKYIPMEDGEWMGEGLTKGLSNRNDSFWNGRAFNALDRFYRGESHEKEQGTLVSPSWFQKEDYISFTLGGHAVNSYVGIFKATDDIASATPLAKVDNREWFIDPSRSSNMAVRFVNASAFKNQELKLALIDHDESGFGFLNFGALQVNQTLNEVASTIDLHRQILAKGASFGTDAAANSNDEAYTRTLEWYNREEYKPFIDAIGSLDRYNLDFEMDSNHLELFGSDTSFEGGRNDLGFYYDLMVSDRESYWWGEHMPFNKTGNRFLCTQNGLLLNQNISQSTAELEAIKARFVTPLFTLSGSGFMSLKMAGATAAIQILDEHNAVLSEFSNPAFVTGVDAVANIMETQVNLNTMVRTIVDASAYLGKKIRVGLVDKGAQDGVWSYPNFDELITYYDAVPSIRVDKITQTHGDPVRSYYGERIDYLVCAENSKHPEAKDAYDFLFGNRDAAHPIGTDGYYAIARSHDKGATFCNLSANELNGMISRYDGLSREAKSLVDSSQDYQHIMSTDQAWYDVEAETIFTVGDSLNYIRNRASNLNFETPVSRTLSSLMNVSEGSTLAILAVLGCVITFGLFCFYKKKKNS